MATINNYSICKRLYQKFGSMSKIYYSVLIDICKTKSIHVTSKNTGVGYRTVKDIAIVFNDYIKLNDKSGLASINDSFTKTIIHSYNKIEIPCYDKVSNKLKLIINSFSCDNSDLDHISANIECCYKRAYDLIANYDIRFCKFLFLGDHDFSSISLGIIAKIMGIQPSIVVMDIDENVLEHIKENSYRNKIRIDTFCCDFRCSVPKQFENSFDVVFTDPPYTTEGMEVFLSKAKLMLVDNMFSTLNISYKCAEQSYALGLNVQKTIIMSGFYIRELLKNYNSYDQAEALGYRSDLYVCSVGKKTQVSCLKKNSINIYTHGRNAIEKYTPISRIDFSFSKSNDSIYIGDDANVNITNRMSVYQFVNSRLSGKFHENGRKNYIVDLRNHPLMIYRILTICDFGKFNLITDEPIDKKESSVCALYSIISMVFRIMLVQKGTNYYVYLIEKTNNYPIIAESIGKRGIMRNCLTENLSLKYKITKNDAREIIDAWDIPEIAKAPLFFLPNCLIGQSLVCWQDFEEKNARKAL